MIIVINETLFLYGVITNTIFIIYHSQYTTSIFVQNFHISRFIGKIYLHPRSHGHDNLIFTCSITFVIEINLDLTSLVCTKASAV